MNTSPIDAEVQGWLLRLGMPAVAFFLAAGFARGELPHTYSRLQIIAFAGLAASFEAARVLVGGRPRIVGWLVNTAAATVAVLLVKFSLEGLPT